MKTDSLTASIVILTALAIMAGSSTMAKPASNSNTQDVLIGFDHQPRPDIVKSHGGEVKNTFEMFDVVHADLPRQALKGVRNNPHVSYVEENGRYHALGETLPWGVNRIDAETVWGTEGGSDVTGSAQSAGSGVDVAVIDTGIDLSHPDLKDNYEGGYDHIEDDGTPNDENGHGTHVAGTVAAVDNTEGVIGTAPEADIYAYKALNEQGSGSYSTIAAAIERSINGPDGDLGTEDDSEVISMSLGGSTKSDTIKRAVQKARAEGALPVAAAGNGGDNNCRSVERSYPAAYSATVAVGATNPDDNVADFSNSADYVDLVAPGTGILSTMPTYSVYLTRNYDYITQDYDKISGTSMATPHVSGVAAMVYTSIKDSDGDGTIVDDVEQNLLNNADDLNEDPRCQGQGMVDADGSWSALDTEEAPTVTVTNPSSGEEVSGTVTLSADASDSDGSVDKVEFFVDSDLVGTDSGGDDTWSVSWDSSKETDGSHTLEAVATDTQGLTDSDSVSFSTENTDNNPSVSWNNPTDGETVSEKLELLIQASDDRSVESVSYRVDDGTRQAVEDLDGDGVYNDSLDTTSLSNGDHSLTAIVNDSGGNSDTAKITVTVDNQPPTVSWVNPTDGERVNGTVTLEASASDFEGSVNSVEFSVDGTTIDTDSDGTDGWTASWDTTNVENGSHTLTATATDDEGDTSTSSIDVDVQNEVNQESPPAIDSYNVTEAGSPNPHFEVTADWKVSDSDGDLNIVKVEVIDSSGDTVEDSLTDVSGSDASGTDQLTVKHVDGQEFDVKLTVSDSAGNEATETRKGIEE